MIQNKRKGIGCAGGAGARLHRVWLGISKQPLQICDKPNNDTLDILVKTRANQCHARQIGIQHARGGPAPVIDRHLGLDAYVPTFFVRKQRESGADLVYGCQATENVDWFEQIRGDLFVKGFKWTSFNWMRETKIPESLGPTASMLVTLCMLGKTARAKSGVVPLRRRKLCHAK